MQSRYYNSEWGRFISADVYADTGDGILGTNMYAYCQNDPVNFVDPSGMKSVGQYMLDFLKPYWNVIELATSLLGDFTNKTGDRFVFESWGIVMYLTHGTVEEINKIVYDPAYSELISGALNLPSTVIGGVMGALSFGTAGMKGGAALGGGLGAAIGLGLGVLTGFAFQTQVKKINAADLQGKRGVRLRFNYIPFPPIANLPILTRIQPW